MTKSLHILYVYSGKARPGAAGLDLVVRQQIQALTEAGHRVTFVSRGKYDHPLVRHLRLPVTPAHVLSSLHSRYYYNAQHRFFSMLGALVVRLGSFDAVVGWVQQSRLFFRAAHRKNIPCLLNCTSAHYEQAKMYMGGEPYYPWPYVSMNVLEEEYRLASILMVASKFARDSFLERSYDPEHVTIIGRGADVRRFQFKPRSKTPFRAVFFARICDRKGILQALEGWRKAGLEDAELWIIGGIDGEIRERVEANLPANARLLGHSDEAEKLLVQCHVQILPTRRENIAKTLIEGAACGLVTLSTVESGFPIEEGKTGFYVSREDTDALAGYLRMLAKDMARTEQMMAASSAYVQEYLTWDLFRERFLETVLRATV